MCISDRKNRMGIRIFNILLQDGNWRQAEPCFDLVVWGSCGIVYMNPVPLLDSSTLIMGLYCGCGRISLNISLYFYISKHLTHTYRKPSFHQVIRRYYRGKKSGIAEICNVSEADSFVSSLTTKERSFLQEALKQHQDDEPEEVPTAPTVAQLRLAAFHSAIPFIGFGFLDNAIMITAGEYIDITLGAALGISTMAAAALGNLISDVSGISLAHYVELAANKMGFEGPGLSSKQMEMPRTRFITNLGRAIGISFGCVLGMFPLLFLSLKDEEEKKPHNLED